VGTCLEGRGHANGIDWLIGRKLPSMVAALSLGHPQAKTDVQNIRGRDSGALYFQLFFAEVRDRAIGAGQTRRRNDRRCLGLVGRPELLDPVLDDDGRVGAHAPA
jgi:hypothetical protein